MACPQICIAWETVAGGILRFSAASARKKDRTGQSQLPSAPACHCGSQPRSIRSIKSITRRTIEPLLDDPLIQFIGEIGEAEKSAFLGNAAALLFPIDWPEPFGLVLIEAMATGTPVIAFGCGSVPEIIEHGVTGFIVDDIDSAVAAVSRATET